MPRFFFDFHDDDVVSLDDAGLELDGVEAAQREAVKALAEIAEEALPGGAEDRRIAVHVRNQEGWCVLVTRLTFVVERPTAGTASGLGQASRPLAQRGSCSM